MHEAFDREEKIKGSSDRSFGLVMACGFAVIALAPLLHLRSPQGGTRWWALVVAVLFLLFALAWPRALAPLNKLWLRFGLLLSRIVSPVVLALLYYSTLVPVGFLMRSVGKDPLKLRFDPAAASYWERRSPPGPAPEGMKNQF